MVEMSIQDQFAIDYEGKPSIKEQTAPYLRRKTMGRLVRERPVSSFIQLVPQCRASNRRDLTSRGQNTTVGGQSGSRVTV